MNEISRAVHRRADPQGRLPHSGAGGRWWILAILLAAAAVRIALVATVSTEDFLEHDGRDYMDIANSLAHGQGFSVSSYRWFEPVPDVTPDFHPDLYRPPLLPLLGAGLYLLPGPWLFWARVSSVVLGTLLVWVVYLVAQRLFTQRTALIAGTLFAIYPYAVNYSARWSTETLFALLLLAGVWALLCSRTQPALRRAGLAGFALGSCCLARPNGIVPAAILAGWRTAVAARGQRLRIAAALVGCMILVLAPWAARNLRLTGVPNPLTFVGPYNLWLGFNDRIYDMYRAGNQADFSQSIDALYQIDSKTCIREMEKRGIFDVKRCDQYWLSEFKAYVRAKPKRAVFILLHRAMHYWRIAPQKAAVPARLYWASILTVGPCLLLALAALVTDRRARHAALVVPPLVGFLASLPFAFHLRLRYPVFDPYLVLLAAAGLDRLLSACGRHTRIGPTRVQP
jgi:4-amino-4-deoxy-L-arabinose transferase-like glycosyltransferase